MTLFPNKKFWATHDGIAIAIVPKVGNTSFSALINGSFLTVDQALSIPTRVMFVRDPIERHISAYSFFQALGPKDCGAIPRDAIQNGYEHYVDFILSVPNPHWAPQMHLTGGIATHLYKFNFSNIRKYWAAHWAGRQPDWLNATTPLPITQYRRNELLDYYADDFAAYNGAL